MSTNPVLDHGDRRPKRREAPESGWERYSVVLFFVLAYLLAWPAALLPHPVCAILSVASPTLAAVIVLQGLKRGGIDRGDLLQPLFQWRASAFWYAVAVLGPVLLASVASAVVLLRGEAPSTLLAAIPWTALPAIFVGRLLINVWEEIGWRGFALPELQARYSGLTASLVIGLFWGLWHLPLYLGEGSDQSRLPFLLLMLDTILISVLYTWLYNNTAGSLLFVTLFHVIGNSVTVLVIEAGMPIASYFVPRFLTILLVDIIVITRYGTGLSQQRSLKAPP